MENSNQKTIIAVVVVVVIIIVLLLVSYFGWFQGPKDTLTTNGFVPEYSDRTENIEIPGDFPIDLVSGEGLDLKTGSYFTRADNGSEMYVYNVRSSGDALELFDNAKNILIDNGFTILDEDSVLFSLSAIRDTEQISYSIYELEGDDLSIIVSYGLDNTLFNNQDQ
jgi:hypothetical protein